MEDMYIYERKYADFQYICGIDEVGRGPLAGPVVAGAVILPKDCDILYLNDSKKVTPKRRDMLFDQIQKQAVAWAVACVDAREIDEIDILNARMKAMQLAIGTDETKAESYAKLLYAQACLMADLPIEDPVEYTRLVCSLMK